ncbi:MAG: glycosyltransferase family 2 protein, partial [Okeania sp. SIO3B3]|nr:glycosyltransferase family 2 protein [Okeania sp. SIO3B3]
SLRLPFRPVIRFIYMYIFLKGCLDGQAGLAWCTLQAFYEYLILIKVWEMKNMPVQSLTSVINANSSKVEIEAQG